MRTWTSHHSRRRSILTRASLVPATLALLASTLAAQIDFDSARAVRARFWRTDNAIAFGDLNGDGLNDYLGIELMSQVQFEVYVDDGSNHFVATDSIVATSPGHVSLIHDLDGDGNNDVLLGSFTLRFYRGDGEGGLTLVGPDFEPGFWARAIHVVDIDKDGNDDLFMLHDVGSRTYFGNGSGGFSSSSDSSFLAADVAFADFDEDGFLDVMTRRGDAGGVRVGLGDGSGVFVPRTVSIGSAATSAVAVGDFDGDGHADLAVADDSLDHVEFHRGDGSGGFVFGGIITTILDPTAIAAGDFDADGDLDLALAGTDSCRILENLGAGTFSESVSLAIASFTSIQLAPLPSGPGDLIFVSPTQGMAYQVRLRSGDLPLAGVCTPIPSEHSAIGEGDFNQDGILDLITSAEGGLATYLGDGTGGFSEAVMTALELPATFEVGDYDEDGTLDVAIAHRIDVPFSPWKLLIMTGNGDGTFTLRTTVDIDDVKFMKKADFDEDGHLDLAVIVEGSRFSERYLAFLWGNGDTTFTRQRLPFFYEAISLAVGSFDDRVDSRTDVMVVDSSLGGTALVRNFGNRTWSVGPAFPNTSPIEAGDFNGDGHLDLAFHGTSTGIRFNSGFGTFPEEVTFDESIEGTMLARDFNHDGNLDISVTGRDAVLGSELTLMYLGNGRGEMAPPRGFGLQGPITTGDFDGDGLIDLVATDSSGPGFVRLARNRSRELERCRPGVVNAFDGPRVDSLTVNGSVGDRERELAVDGSMPIEVSIDRAPSPAANGNYYAAIWAGAPDASTASAVRTGAGFACFQPIRIEPDYRMPLHVANTLRPSDPRLDPPSAHATGNPAPGVAIAIPGGTFAPGTVLTAQGIVGDAATLSRKNASVTNAVVITVE